MRQIIKQKLANKSVNLSSGIAALTILCFSLFFSCEENPVYYKQLVYNDYVVKYEVTGTVSKANIVFADENDQPINRVGVPLPWTKEFVSNGNTHVSCTANSNDYPGSITVTIYVDDAVFATSTSGMTAGLYVSAFGTVSGSRHSEIIKVYY